MSWSGSRSFHSPSGTGGQMRGHPRGLPALLVCRRRSRASLPGASGHTLLPASQHWEAPFPLDHHTPRLIPGLFTALWGPALANRKPVELTTLLYLEIPGAARLSLARPLGRGPHGRPQVSDGKLARRNRLGAPSVFSTKCQTSPQRAAQKPAGLPRTPTPGLPMEPRVSHPHDGSDATPAAGCADTLASAPDQTDVNKDTAWNPRSLTLRTCICALVCTCVSTHT